ncbi:MAG: hypothetical protein IKI31_06865, partial [Treponema sp.]|nr:hypothetical protein [Treponema sp.]
MRKFLLMLIFSLFILFASFAGVHGSQQLIQSGHWSYDALFILQSECGTSSLACVAPITVGEFKMHFEKVDYEKLSYSGQKLYEKLLDYFEWAFQIKLGPVRAGLNIELNPAFMFKSNKNLDWTFATDYTGHITNGSFSYTAASNFYANEDVKDFAS